ncbi:MULTISPECIES: hypothetical protein [Streptomyces]|uniref:hypothetical protein n=1 Tax=Streptomyces TaxID=1883 RepID=UPI002E13821E|nr:MULTISPECIES: hypothetical protein [unclassified Streptomyces]WSQ03900.1 hypothetical protein OG444_40320 [Streptomyces sp. NBC_01232]WSR21164.1 hypothetical protein OG457_49585 [Streptomyces sp. NBC_01207]
MMVDLRSDRSEVFFVGLVTVQVLAGIVLLVAGACVVQEWGAAHFRAAFAYLAFGGGLGVGMLVFAGEVRDVLTALV